MPHNTSVPVREKPSHVFKGEKPVTNFKDGLNSIKVDLIHWPDETIHLSSYAFQKATWANRPYVPGENPKEDKKLLSDLKIEAFQGNGLPLSLELYDFVFSIAGITRIVTHQVVRNRIGATYSQQCSGDKDWRHHDVLVPRSLYKNNDLYERFKKNVLEAKQLYADMLDTMDIPILDARRVLPHCLETFIYVKFNLVTLMSFIQKRDCTQTQEPEMVIVARQMRDTVLNKFPFLEKLLENKCKSGGCFYTKSDRLTGTSMFIPDKLHDFDYNKDNFIYDKTVFEMVYDLPEVKTEKYIGFEKI